MTKTNSPFPWLMRLDPYCRLALLIAAFIGSLLGNANLADAESSARTSVRAGAIEPFSGQQTQDGPAIAHASVAGSEQGASWHAEATVGLREGGPFLAAGVNVTAPADNETHFQWRTGGRAVASMYDELTFGGLVPATGFSGGEGSFPILAEVAFSPAVTGSVHGNATAEFYLSASSPSGSSIYRRNEESWDTSDTTHNSSKGSAGYSFSTVGPHPVVAQVFLHYTYVPEIDSYLVTSETYSYSMELDVTAISHPSYMASDASYLHTAVLGPLLVLGADGNALPGAEFLSVTGSSGIHYQTVPEPSSVMLLLVIGTATLVLGCYKGALYKNDAQRKSLT